MDIKTMTADERKYTYRQSQQISMQASFIGYLRADFGSSGKEFYSSWNDFRKDLKTDEFKTEFDEVINALRSDKYGLLKSRSDMSAYARQYVDCAFKGCYCTEYGFRVDTEKHTYLLRCNPTRGDYNFYCCRFIDECHTEVGNNIFHICEFAERMLQNGATYKPKQAEQPPQKAPRKSDYER